MKKEKRKKLHFGVSKFHKMHVGVKKLPCPDLKIDEWEVKVVEDYNTNYCTR